MEARSGRAGRREYVQVLRLLESFGLEDLDGAVKDALRLGAIGFDAVKHLVLCRVERRPPKLDLDVYPYLPKATVDGLSATAAAEQHGYSRAAFYLIVTAFEDRGMQGLVDGRRGRRGPLKLTPEIVDFIAGTGPEVSSAHLAEQIEQQFSVRLHRRTVERARR